MKRVVLFKSPDLIVNNIQIMDGQSSPKTETVLTVGTQTIFLDPTAAQVLVGYLKIIKAYLLNSEETKMQIPKIFEEVISHLELQLKFNGKKKADYVDVNELIKQKGCLYDWVTKKNVLMKTEKILF